MDPRIHQNLPGSTRIHQDPKILDPLFSLGIHRIHQGPSESTRIHEDPPGSTESTGSKGPGSALSPLGSTESIRIHQEPLRSTRIHQDPPNPPDPPGSIRIQGSRIHFFPLVSNAHVSNECRRSSFIFVRNLFVTIFILLNDRSTFAILILPYCCDMLLDREMIKYTSTKKNIT